MWRFFKLSMLILLLQSSRVAAQSSEMLLHPYGIANVQLGKCIKDGASYTPFKDFDGKSAYLAYPDPGNIYLYNGIAQLPGNNYLSKFIENIFVGVSPDSLVKRIFVHVRRGHNYDSVYNELVQVYGEPSSLSKASSEGVVRRTYTIWNTSAGIQIVYYHSFTEMDPIPEIGFVFLDGIEETLGRYKLIKKNWVK